MQADEDGLRETIPEVKNKECQGFLNLGILLCTQIWRPKEMDRYVLNIEDIILFTTIYFVNIRKNICKDNMLESIALDDIG